MFIGPVMIWKICEDRTTCWEVRNLPQDKWAEPTFQAQVHCSFYQDTNCKSSFQLSRVLLGQADFSGNAVAGGLGGGRWLLVATGWRELDLIIPSGELLRFTVTAAVHGVQIMSGLSVWRKRGKNHMNSQGSSWEVGSITSKERIHTCRGQRRTSLGKQEPRTLANFGKNTHWGYMWFSLLWQAHRPQHTNLQKKLWSWYTMWTFLQCLYCRLWSQNQNTVRKSYCGRDSCTRAISWV